MQSDINVLYHNEVHAIIDAEPAILAELADYFTFDVPGAAFVPAFRQKLWDGKIRLLNVRTKKLYAGLTEYIRIFAKKRMYSVSFDPRLEPEEILSYEEAKKFMNSILPEGMELREYQVKAFREAVNRKRNCTLLPTGAGKSFNIYALTQWYKDKKILFVGDMTSMVLQIRSDFIEYGESDDNIHCIMAGKEHDTNKRIVASTWQSIYEKPKKWFSQFDVIIGDEIQSFAATSLKKLMEKMENCRYRHGFTATLQEAKTHRLVIEGAFGHATEHKKTKELIREGILTKLKVKCLVLKYMQSECRKRNYHDEIEYLCTHERRNNFLCKLSLALKGNTLLLFERVDLHGKVLYNLLKEMGGDSRKVFLIHGGIKADEREKIRKAIENEKNAILVASYKTLQKAVNIKRLHNIIYASPFKDAIRNKQSIGRSLRKLEGKTSATLYDIADSFNEKNYTYEHFERRVETYISEGHEYTIRSIKI